MTVSTVVCVDADKAHTMVLMSLIFSIIFLVCLALVFILSRQSSNSQSQIKALSLMLAFIAFASAVVVLAVNVTLSTKYIKADGTSPKPNTKHMCKMNKVHALKDLATANYALSIIAVFAGIYIIGYSMNPWRLKYADNVFTSLQMYAILYGIVAVILSAISMTEFQKN
jgi:hypothetical protein